MTATIITKAPLEHGSRENNMLVTRKELKIIQANVIYLIIRFMKSNLIKLPDIPIFVQALEPIDNLQKVEH